MPIHILKSEGDIKNLESLLVENGNNIWVHENSVCKISARFAIKDIDIACATVGALE